MLLPVDLAVWDGHVAMVSTRQMTHAAMSVRSSRPPRPTTLAIKGRFDSRHRVRQVGLPKHQGPQSVRSSIGYAIRNSTKAAAGTEQTDLELIELSHRRSGGQ